MGKTSKTNGDAATNPAPALRRWTPRPETLGEMLTWRKRGLVEIEGDLFPKTNGSDPYGDYEGRDFVDALLAMIALRPNHAFLLRTANPKVMASYFASRSLADVHTDILASAATERAYKPSPVDYVRGYLRVLDSWEVRDGQAAKHPPPKAWPLPNLLLGTTIRTQADANRLLPALLQCPGRTWVDVVPEGPIDLSNWLHLPYGRCPKCGGRVEYDLPLGMLGGLCCGERINGGGQGYPALAWLRVRGEDKPVHPDWIRSLRDQCIAAGVPFFFKRWGEYEPMTDAEGYGYALTNEMDDEDIRDMTKSVAIVEPEGRVVTPKPNRQWWDDYQDECWHRYHEPEGPKNDPAVPYAMHRVGKKTAGRVLDGRTWDEFPGVSP